MAAEAGPQVTDSRSNVLLLLPQISQTPSMTFTLPLHLKVPRPFIFHPLPFSPFPPCREDDLCPVPTTQLVTRACGTEEEAQERRQEAFVLGPSSQKGA